MHPATHTKMTSARLYIALGLVLFLAPLPYGSNRPWAIGFLACFALLAFAITLLRDRHWHQWRELPDAWLLGFLAFSVLQFVPLPAWLLPGLPAQIAERLPDIDGLGRTAISYDLFGSFAELIRWSTYFAVFAIAQRARSEAQFLALVYAIFLAGVVNAGYGLANSLTGGAFDGAVFNAWHQGVAGTYANRNHFAGLMELTIGSGVTLLLHRKVSSLTGRAWHGSVPELWLLVGGIAVASSGLLLSGSRGGVLALITALLVASFVAWRRSGGFSIRPLHVVAVLGALVAISIILVLDDWMLERFRSAAFAGARLPLWLDTLDLYRDHWLLGIGGGAYLDVFPIYKTDALPLKIYDHAHNDYLEFLSEYGLLGGLMLGAFFLSAFRRVYARSGRRMKAGTLSVGLGVLVAISAFLAHAFVDFNMHIPANMVIFMVMLGLGNSAYLGRLGRHRSTRGQSVHPVAGHGD